MAINPRVDAAIRKLNARVRYTKEGIPIAADGVPHHGPMAQHVESHMKEAHHAHMDRLKNDPDPWPNLHEYKTLMRAARKHGIKTWHAQNPPQPPQPEDA